MANNKYALVNTQFNQTDVTLIEQLNGRQGDSGRVVYFSLRDGNIPHNISNQNIAIIVKDAAGKIKILSTVNNVISSAGGLFSMVMPGELYQAAGDVQEAFMQISDDNNTVLSSIPIMFTVVANNIIMTANASNDYVDTIQKAVEHANELINGLGSNIQAQQIAYESLQASLNQLNTDIANKPVAFLKAENTFLEKNTFENDAVFLKEISGNFKNKTIGSSSLDSITQTGIYEIDPSINSGKSGSILQVYNYKGNIVYQTLFDNKNGFTAVMTRYYNGSIWSNWATNIDNRRTSKIITVNGLTVNLTRSGNMVIFFLHNYGSQYNTVYASQFATWASAGTVPNGYKPSILTRIPAGHSQGAKSDGTVSEIIDGDLAVNIDGSIVTRKFDMPVPLNGVSPWIDASGCYLTFDDFPIS